MNMRRHFLVALVMVWAAEALPQQPECMNDSQCDGERICLRSTCATPQLHELFPGASTPTPGLFRYVIKTTRADCIKRGGDVIGTKQKKKADETEVARCLLPGGTRPEEKKAEK
jgi:putative hemolysin